MKLRLLTRLPGSIRGDDMALNDCKIKDEDFDSLDIESLSDRPSADGMSAQALKERFDAGAKKVIKPKYNELIKVLTGTEGAANIGITPVEGVSANTVQQFLTAIKLLLDDKPSVEQSNKELAKKFDETEAQSLVKEVTFSASSGVFTVTKYDGSVQRYNTALQKVALDVRLEGQQFVLTLADGTKQYVDLSEFITQYEVKGSDTVTMSIDDGSIVAKVKNGSITVAHLSAELAEYIKNSASGADWSAAEGEAGYVKGRTHWKEVLVPHAYLVPETNFTFNGSMISISGVGTNNISEGSTYIVTWNGTAYKCTAHDYDGELCLGNSSLIGNTTNTGEPFVITTLTTSTSWVTKKFTNPEVVKLCVEQPEEAIYHTLDPQYFPEGMIGEKGEKGDPGTNGKNGADGVGVKSVEQTTTSSEDGGVNVITITLTNGTTETFAVRNGSKGDTGEKGEKGATGSAGADGEDGADGVSVQSVAQTTASTEDGGANIITVTLSNGKTQTFTVRNGSKGSKGDTGDKGDKGDTGATGPQGVQGIQGEKGDKGEQGAKGDKGDTGSAGQRGCGILKVTSSPSNYTTTTNGVNPIKRMALSTIKSEANVSEVVVGDLISYSYYLYHVYYIDATYAYVDTSVSIRGAKGATGSAGVSVESIVQTTTSSLDGGENIITTTLSDGTKSTFSVLNGSKGSKGDTPEKGYDYWTEEDKNEMKLYVAERLSEAAEAGVHVITNADMAENNEAAIGYVKNRTHWKEVISEKAEIIPNTTVSFKSEMSSVTGIGKNHITEGVTYIVTWNGKKYECIAHKYGYDLYLGNSALVGDTENDTGEPFTFEAFGATSCYIYKNTNTAEDVAIRVETPDNVVFHKLDGNYLPDGLPYTDGGMVEVLPKTTIEGADDSGDGINDSLMLMLPELVSGKTYIVYWNGTEYECVGKEVKKNGVTGVILGNGAGMGLSGNNEPFSIVHTSMFLEMSGGLFNTMISFTDGDTHPNPTISIRGSGGTVHKLDNKYLDLAWLPTINGIQGETIFEEAIVTLSDELEINGTIYYLGSLSGMSFTTIKQYEKLLIIADGIDYKCDVVLSESMYCAIPEGYTVDIQTMVIDAPLFIIGNTLYSTSRELVVKITNYIEYYNKMPKEFLPADDAPTKAYTNLSAKSTEGNYAIYATRDEAERNNTNGMSDVLLEQMWNKGRIVVVDVITNAEYEVVAIDDYYVVIVAEINGKLEPTKLYGFLS